MAIINHQNNFATNLTSNTSAGATTSPLNSIPSISADFYLAFDATNINGHYEVRKITSKTATNVNHTATTYDHTTAEEVRMIIPAEEMDSLWNAVTNTPRGYLLNGKLSVLDSAGITVAVKTLAGTDPSTSDPVYIRIGDTVRSITSALSRSLADGTNWFNAGSAELATKEIDYFLYAVWDSNSSAVALGFARIPGANLVSDFSATTTNEKYIAGYSGFTTTDEVEVIGRFAATLSAGAGYTWTVPTFTAANLIQRPEYLSKKSYFLPSWTSSGTQPAIGNGIIYGDYMVHGHRVSGVIYLQIGSTTTAGTGTYSLQLPFKCNSDTSLHAIGSGSILDNGTIWYMSNAFLNTVNGSVFGLTWNGNVGGNWSATTPMAPANGDIIRLNFSYEI